MVHYDKRLSLSDLAGADIVLTTYGVVVAEHGGAQESNSEPANCQRCIYIYTYLHMCIYIYLHIYIYICIHTDADKILTTYGVVVAEHGGNTVKGRGFDRYGLGVKAQGCGFKVEGGLHGSRES